MAIVAAVLAILVIRRISTHQDAVIDRLEAGGERGGPAGGELTQIPTEG